MINKTNNIAANGESSVATINDPRHDLGHFLKLAAAQVRHRMKSLAPAESQQMHMLQLLEDLINEQGQSNENSRASTGPTR